MTLYILTLRSQKIMFKIFYLLVFSQLDFVGGKILKHRNIFRHLNKTF